MLLSNLLKDIMSVELKGIASERVCCLSALDIEVQKLVGAIASDALEFFGTARTSKSQSAVRLQCYHALRNWAFNMKKLMPPTFKVTCISCGQSICIFHKMCYG
ncbi:hypothetical protein C5167_003057 [Papaver somniferum]|uniref:Uncharacterized protein n=1 Tax=Papaver somniferum TaxID=3469 RepID=A0A4Y7L2I6_PAPSO|nr:hypothetical protein C5167_003057 [Papaver somniferum]